MTYKFNYRFTCPKCNDTGQKIIQYRRSWRELESFEYNHDNHHVNPIIGTRPMKAELLTFRCGNCKKTITDDAGHAVEGINAMYTWLHQKRMLRNTSGNTVTNDTMVPAKDPKRSTKYLDGTEEEEIPLEQCDPALLP